MVKSSNCAFQGPKRNRQAVTWAHSWGHPWLLLHGGAELSLSSPLPSHELQPLLITATFPTFPKHAELWNKIFTHTWDYQNRRNRTSLLSIPRPSLSSQPPEKGIKKALFPLNLSHHTSDPLLFRTTWAPRVLVFAFKEESKRRKYWTPNNLYCCEIVLHRNKVAWRFLKICNRFFKKLCQTTQGHIEAKAGLKAWVLEYSVD